MKTNIIYIKGFFFLCAICFVSNLSLYATQDSSPIEQSPQHRNVKFSTSIVTATPTTTTYQSGSKLNKTMLDSTPSGNGDITSILKIIPNVQFDNAQLKSSTPGEIDPANISISGGLFYQNNFQLDGFNMNNDLDPNGGGATNGPNALRSGRSQGLAVDTSLLESIQVQDSNISAAYGGFTGGVVEANVRKPRADKGGLFGWHGGVSYQFTGSDLTQYFIDESQEANFITSSNENYQPNFTKHLIRANLEGYATQNLGIITSFSTTRSFIPLKGYSFDIGTEANATREQHRYIDNYYIKTHYNPSEKLTLEASLAYMPQDNTYYDSVAKHSFYKMKSGGIQSGLKALYDSNIGLWSNTLSYSFMQNSRESEKNYFMSWYYSQGDKDWAGTNSKNPRASEGGYGDMEQIQNTLNYKSNMNFESWDLWKSEHTLNIGFEANYTYAYRNRKNPYYVFGNPVKLDSKPCGTDSMFDFATCSNTQTQDNEKPPWQGQYFDKVTESKPGEIALDNLAYGIYAEDSILLDLEQIGKIQTRLGLRLDGDTYMQKHTLAPRFSLNYTAPWEEYKSELIFGANRYYGRNLLSYRLYELVANSTQEYKRTDSNSSWTPTTAKEGQVSYAFHKLNVPYSDELMGGIMQNLGLFSLSAKYIYRHGQDEVMKKSIKQNKSSITTWTNDGESQSHIITLSLQSTEPLEIYSVKNHILFAFDYTKVARSYNLYSTDDAYLNNDDIIYNGIQIKYKDRPTENFARPFTLRLSTTHTFKLWRTKWLFNNFFRYRGGYDAMVLLNKTSPGYNPSSTLKQYGKMHFDGAFSWDMRLGFEMNIWKDNVVFVNFDIYNVLNTRNKAALSGTNGAVIPGIPSSASVAVYEIGRQFWIQGGYKF